MGKKTKDAKCVICGVDFQASLFASLKTCRCDDCKGSRKAEDIGDIGGINPSIELMAKPQKVAVVDYSEKVNGPRIDGEPNRALARLACPLHPYKQMAVIGVIKSSWGDILDFQCREKGCYTRVSITERPRNGYPMQTTGCGTDYEPTDALDAIENGNIAEWHSNN